MDDSEREAAADRVADNQSMNQSMHQSMHQTVIRIDDSPYAPPNMRKLDTWQLELFLLSTMPRADEMIDTRLLEQREMAKLELQIREPGIYDNDDNDKGWG
jgi:hypothetical protein